MKQNIIEHLPGPERFLIANACDKARQAIWQNAPRFTEFLDPGRRALLEQYSYLWDATMLSCGGYAEAERQMVAFTPPSYALAPDEFPMAAIEVAGNQTFGTVTHRDYLGSLLALGIERGIVGDILVGPHGCQVLVQAAIAPYILANWEAVGRMGIKTKRLALSDLQPPEQKLVWSQATVASLRLDAILSAAYGLSRTKAAALIKAGKVKHNFLPEIRVDREVAAGDVLSIAGKGRAELREVGGRSKKGRLFVRIARPL